MNLSDTDQAPYSAPAPQTATVSDEAVQVGINAYYGSEDSHPYDMVKNIITAAIPHLTISAATCSVEVKKLRWTETMQLDGRKQWCSDDNESVAETHSSWAEQGYRLFFAGTTYPTLEEAKAAAQADFEHRILSQIVTKPVDAVAVRDPILTEAIVRQAMHEAWNDICYDTGCHPTDIEQLGRRRLQFHPHHWASSTYDRIRALSPDEPVDDEPAYYALTDSDWSFDGRDEGRATIVLANSPEEAVRKATDIEIAEQGEGVGIHWKVAKLTLVGFQGAEWDNSKPSFDQFQPFTTPTSKGGE